MIRVRLRWTLPWAVLGAVVAWAPPAPGAAVPAGRVSPSPPGPPAGGPQATSQAAPATPSVTARRVTPTRPRIVRHSSAALRQPDPARRRPRATAGRSAATSGACGDRVSNPYGVRCRAGPSSGSKQPWDDSRAVGGGARLEAPAGAAGGAGGDDAH